MTWIPVGDRKPKHNQWVAVPLGDGFKAGQYDANHPFAPAIVDRMTGKFYHGFQFWKPLTHPKVPK